MSTDNELDAMTDEQAAEYYYRHRDEIEQEPGEPVDFELARLPVPGGIGALACGRGQAG